MNESVKTLCQYVEGLHKNNIIEYKQYISLYDLIANVTVEFEKLEQKNEALNEIINIHNSSANINGYNAYYA